jgi:hypothetical protein
VPLADRRHTRCFLAPKKVALFRGAGEGGSLMWNSPQVTRRIRDQHHTLTDRLDHLRRAAEQVGADDLLLATSTLGRELSEHFGLVEAVLEAVSEDDVAAAGEP